MSDIHRALNAFSAGEMVIVFDEHREAEGDFFCLAQTITPEQVNFLLTHARGMICVPCAEPVLSHLNLSRLSDASTSTALHDTRYVMSVDAREGVTTGVSAPDRAKAIRLLGNPHTRPEELLRPGHTFPLSAEPDITKRFGHTEAVVQMAQYVKKYPVGVVCEILDEAGNPADREYLTCLAQKYTCPLVTLQELYEFFLAESTLV